VKIYRSSYPSAELAAQKASGPEAIQGAYDTTRDLQEAVRAATPVSRECRGLLSALSRYAGGRIRQYEGVDRPSAADEAAGRSRAERAKLQAQTSAPACGGAGGPSRPRSLAISPSDNQVFYGSIVAQAPRGADAAELLANGQSVLRARVSGGQARFTVKGTPSQYDLRVNFTKAGRPAGGTQARDVWFLGSRGLQTVPGSRTSSSLSSGLVRAMSGRPRYRAAWVQNLSTGETAGVNASAAFPAASTVKLGLMVGAITRLGAKPESSAYGYDLKAIAAWSSNLATNRVLRRLGGTTVANEGFRRLGARSSTFPGEYIVGTELQPSLPSSGSGGGPPSVSQRVTTAQDLARMLYGIHASAADAPGARAQTGLTTHQARLLLGWLLSSQQRADNTSLLAGGAGGAPIAQKNGWINDARLGAGIVYTADGPVIAVLATYDESGVALGEAQNLGARITQLAAG
jgi:Beta-lactamase enzyme family